MSADHLDDRRPGAVALGVKLAETAGLEARWHQQTFTPGENPRASAWSKPNITPTIPGWNRANPFHGGLRGRVAFPSQPRTALQNELVCRVNGRIDPLVRNGAQAESRREASAGPEAEASRGLRSIRRPLGKVRRRSATISSKFARFERSLSMDSLAGAKLPRARFAGHGGMVLLLVVGVHSSVRHKAGILLPVTPAGMQL